MEKRLKRYLMWMEQLSNQELSVEQKREIQQDMLVQIQFFQHERLIHLIVTVLFAILTMLSVLASILLTQVGLLVLIVLLVILLVPYIRHYYILENGVQKLYEYYDNFGKMCNTDVR